MPTEMSSPSSKTVVFPGKSDPLWYKDAIIYELHVRAFADSNGDGIGDFNGLIGKLSYLQDLGVTALWLLPFYPSPLRDDGYDIADYTGVHPDYGTLADFKRFLSAAHQRGLRVITELAINHTSTEHPWFQRARRAPAGSRHRDFYVWSDSPDRFGQARIIFEDFETSNWAWDPLAGAYYWHRFYSHQPDLNFQSPDVQRAVLKVMDFWMGLGVDGMRLDAIPYLFEREGTNCENLPETHAFLKRLRAHVDDKFEDRMLLAEANQWPDDAAAYFGDGDECHMNFHFPVMPRLFMSVQLENRFPIVDILQQTPEIPPSCQWALFLRNHDELTLEMVTDEDRDYMYRSYAEDPRMRVNVGIRRRLSPLLRLRRKIELMNGLLMSLPGTPVLYYGDEIGQGDNVYLGDRNGVRTPMQWSGDRNAGFSRANPQKLYLPVITDPEYHYEAINVEAQQSNPESLLWWMKRMIALRRQHPVFGRGQTRFLDSDNIKVLSFIRSDESTTVLVAANLSRHTQYAELELSEYSGLTPIEMSGGTRFPDIGELPYLITLGGYSFVWFQLRDLQEGASAGTAEVPVLELADPLRALGSPTDPGLSRTLMDFISGRRWFRSKAKAMKSVRVADALPLATGAQPLWLAVVWVEYDGDLPEHYLLPLALAADEDAATLLAEGSPSLIARLRGADGSERVLYEPTGTPQLGERLLSLLSRRRTVTGRGGLRFDPSRALRAEIADPQADLAPWAPSLEQSNTVFFYGQQLAIKLFRQLDGGVNPEVEVGRFLSARDFPNIATVLGTIDYDGPGLQRASAGIVQRFVSSTRNAWDLTLESLTHACEVVLSQAPQSLDLTLPEHGLLTISEEGAPQSVRELLGGYLPLARLLAQRTAELHLCLASDAEDEAFRPEPLAGHYRRSLVQAARDRLHRTLQLLGKRLPALPEAHRPLAQAVLAVKEPLTEQVTGLLQTELQLHRIRTHGDYHLGQVLYDGRDFVIIDFEGEPAVSLAVRRLKRSALTDVCGMLRSFHYAATMALQHEMWRPMDREVLRSFSTFWYHWVGVSFVAAYLQRAGDAPFLASSADALRALMRVHLIDKCAYELAYEINNRPAWIDVPLSGLQDLGAVDP